MDDLYGVDEVQKERQKRRNLAALLKSGLSSKAWKKRKKKLKLTKASRKRNRR